MLKSFLFVGVCLTATFTFAQKKELTLKEAVTQQYRNFAPDKMLMFQWIPGTENFVYLDGYVKLMKGSATGEKAVEWFTIQDVNKILGSQLNWFSGLDWKDSKTFWLNDGINYYAFDTETKTGKLVAKLDENAENATFESNNQRVAFTIENNLFAIGADGKQIAITKNTDKNIVSGQSIARNEFGISGGIFWSPNGNALAYYQKDETDVTNYPLVDITETPATLMNIKYPMAGQGSEKPSVGIFAFAKKKSSLI